MATVSDHAKRVHEFLLSPEAYPHKPTKVELKETHISWVYLTDRYVYKQKKPVTFDFLDFSTVELRKHFCETEVALNRRFSPDIYLSVVPVTCDSLGDYHLNRGRNAVEWLVKMARLNDCDTLENHIRKQQVTTETIEQVSNRLAEFYISQAPAVLRSDEFVEKLRHHIFENRNDLLKMIADSEQEIQFVTNSQLRCLAFESGFFRQRVCDGRVVDGHGDLRPEHIYLHGGDPVIIDCVEFSSEYRTNDVIDELAFLAMECDRLGNEAMGECLFATYAEHCGDLPPRFLPLFYKCYRGCVRAKIAALRASQQCGEPSIHSIQQAGSYLELARTYARDLGHPIVVILGGLMGTGKSTLAMSLQDAMASVTLQTDAIRNQCFERNGNEIFGQGKYSSAARQLVYRELTARIGEALLRSPTLVLDGSFSCTSNRRDAAKEATRHGAKVLQVQCVCTPKESKERISERLARGGAASEARPDLYAQQAAAYEPLLDDVETLEISTEESTQLQLDAVISRIRQLSRS